MSTRNERGQFTYEEIHHQPVAWEHTLQLVDSYAGRLCSLAEDREEWIFSGCGSAYNVSQTAAPTFQHFTGVRSCSVPAADLIYFPETVLRSASNPLVVLISRSGETSETVSAVRAVKERGARILAITCDPESTLARLSDVSLALTAASEKSVITTQSLTAMVLCVQAISAIIGKKTDYLDQLSQLPDRGQKVLDQAEDLGRQLSDNAALSKFAFVGNGPLFGLAKEAQLKLKETVLLPTDGYPLFDFRHGPKSNVDQNMLVTVLLSDVARGDEITFVEDMKKLSGNTLVLCDSADARINTASDYVFELDSGLHELARGILYLLPIHFLAYYRSLARGFDPDNPVNLTYYVEM